MHQNESELPRASKLDRKLVVCGQGSSGELGRRAVVGSRPLDYSIGNACTTAQQDCCLDCEKETSLFGACPHHCTLCGVPMTVCNLVVGFKLSTPIMMFSCNAAVYTIM